MEVSMRRNGEEKERDDVKQRRIRVGNGGCQARREKKSKLENGENDRNARKWKWDCRRDDKIWKCGTLGTGVKINNRKRVGEIKKEEKDIEIWWKEHD
jgi:hypothetical protein